MPLQRSSRQLFPSLIPSCPWPMRCSLFPHLLRRSRSSEQCYVPNVEIEHMGTHEGDEHEIKVPVLLSGKAILCLIVAEKGQIFKDPVNDHGAHHGDLRACQEHQM